MSGIDHGAETHPRRGAAFLLTALLIGMMGGLAGSLIRVRWGDRASVIFFALLMGIVMPVLARRFGVLPLRRRGPGR